LKSGSAMIEVTSSVLQCAVK